MDFVLVEGFDGLMIGCFVDVLGFSKSSIVMLF